MSRTALDQDLDAYVRHGRSRGWAPGTVKNYTALLRRSSRCLRARGCRRSADVTPDDLEALLRDEQERGTATSTRNRLVVLLHHVFDWLRERGRVLTDPARLLPLPDEDDAELPEPPLSESEVRAFLDGLPRRTAIDLRNVCLCELLYGCALRRSEAIGLDCTDVDLVRGTVLVRGGKGGQNRLLPLPDATATAVRDWLALRRTLLRGPDRGELLIGQRGGRLRPDSVNVLIDRINVRRGPDLRRIHPHLLRHSLAVHLLRGGADVRHVQVLLGHASIDTTRIYLRMVPGHLKEAYDKAMPEIEAGVKKWST